ncbi:chromate transporter [Serpentinicella alkaliphila]|uniref:Chromate transporter n=1 Tax=Serpentinicella alkaliphila TaxID=1734049 RepID=A0A4R2TQX5_9FIRM|nr:chromate transporter [Serpentinicella alkaliphila]QUH24725.1 chromate transporter [Serpentinicella alkaliphila]TCQ03715.1 chromate transporter [Serpentinicella alkaliphila]
MVIFRIIISFLKIGAFSFGGGYAMLPVIQEEVVNLNQWLTESEFIDIVAISQMSPGPISVNVATFVGYTQFGILGAVIATTSVVIVSFFLVTSLAKLITKHKDIPIIEGIFKGIRPSVIGLIGAACVSLFNTSIIDLKSLAIAVIVLIALYKFKLHPIGAIIFSGFLGILFYSI